MATEAQIAANRANSELSKGPKTPEGKARVSHNAVRNALTGATVLLPSDDAAVYEQYARNAYARWQPANQAEEFLVQSILDTEWRLLRIPVLIDATWALARHNFAELFADHPEPVRSMMLEAHINEVKGRELRNLALQDARLTRKRDRHIAELKEIQAERRKREKERLEAAAHMYQRFKEEELDFEPSKFGFEFSIEQIEEKVAYWQGRRIGCQYPEQYAKYFGSKILMCERLGLNPEDYTGPDDFDQRAA
ncbi:MAG TPA: hypothetical protein VKX25_18370 [Bryobacteraceae bacterium]|jgi:hypothetical protein|nr:hypothetical protein [Bryobacteraceae bacterium]